MLERIRALSASIVQLDRATLMIGMSNAPPRASAWRAGKICLYARSPVAPKNTNASDEIGAKLAIPRYSAHECLKPATYERADATGGAQPSRSAGNFGPVSCFERQVRCLVA
jgi:hypothetical protein